MHEKRVALITGANKGIGLQIAKDLAQEGLTVLIGSRSISNGEEAAEGIGGEARAIQLDVTDEASVKAAADRIRSEFGRLDVLVNNAGIAFAGDSSLPFEERMKTNLPSTGSLANMRAVYETNVFGVAAVTQAMLPLLREAPAARIVNVGSTSGSLTRNSDPSYEYRHVFGLAYSTSKTALHAVTLAFANELEKTNIKVNIACPGYTATDLNSFRGTRSVEEGAREAVRLALLGPDGSTGTFSNDEGQIPW